MTEKKSQKSQLTGTQRSTLTKRQLEHQYKLSLMRDCLMYGKSFEDSKLYFNSKEFSLSKSQSTKLKKELKSTKFVKEWFSKEALYVMEEDHMLSIERIRSLEDKLLVQFNIIYIKIKKSPQDIHLLIKLIAQFQSLQETKTKMFSATPLVQELMEVHRQQEENENSQ